MDARDHSYSPFDYGTLKCCTKDQSCRCCCMLLFKAVGRTLHRHSSEMKNAPLESQEYELCREIKTIACKCYTLSKGVVTSIAFYNDERDVYCLLVFVVSLYMTTNTNKHRTCQCIAWHFQSPLLTALNTMVQRSYKPVVSWSCHGFSFGDMQKEIEPRAGDLLRL